MRSCHSASKRSCQAGEVGGLGEGLAFTLPEPGVKVRLLKPHAAALQPDMRDSALLHPSIDSTKAYSQLGTKLLDREKLVIHGRSRGVYPHLKGMMPTMEPI